jgi:hypothetical protein
MTGAEGRSCWLVGKVQQVDGFANAGIFQADTAGIAGAAIHRLALDKMSGKVGLAETRQVCEQAGGQGADVE